MRIISGELRGRKLLSPAGLGTRPMLGRVREALFSAIGQEVLEAQVLDLFAGTGSLGLEALSRGAQGVHFVERDRKVISILKRNVQDTGMAERSHVWPGDALAPGAWGEVRPDIVFMDPPYPMLREAAGRKRVLQAVHILLTERMVSDGLLVLHTEPRSLSEHDFDASWQLRKKNYGRTVLWYLHLGGEKP